MDSPVIKAKTLIRVEGVTFTYGHDPVLENVSFSIHEGDFLAILGPNGSGKTTLVKIILGLLKPARGSVFLMGKSVEKFGEWRKIGYVPQKATHFDPLFPASAKEVVAMALLSSAGFLHRMNKEEETSIHHALELVGMTDFASRRIGELSGGHQQRVFIARAIVQQPRILFLDEPTTGVDAETQALFYEILDRLNKNEGITIVQVTHDIGIVNKHITQVACLNQRLVYHGSHEEFCRSDTLKNMLAGGHHLISHQH
jgi:zinc transport system ATP-binding protein